MLTTTVVHCCVQQSSDKTAASNCIVKHRASMETSFKAARRDAATHRCRVHKSSAGTGQTGRLPGLQGVERGGWGVDGGRGEALTKVVAGMPSLPSSYGMMA